MYQIIPAEDWKNRVLILFTSLLCLLGRRVGEILTLPAQRMQTDYSGKKFLYYYPQKKRPGNIEVFKRKLNPLTKTVALVEDILNELYDLTDEQREISAWIYENEKPYLDGLKLTGFDESSSINLKNDMGIKAPDSFLKTRGIETYRKAGQVGCFFRYSDLIKKLRNDLFLRPALHVTHPRQNLYLKDILAVGFKNFAHSKRQTFKYATEPINEQHLRDFLNGRRGIVKSIFEKHGLNEQSGEIICLTSHQPRHFLNNLLDEGGAPDTIQLEWFGRTYKGDNKAYQHKTTARRGGRKPGTSNKNSNLAYLQKRLQFAKEEAEKYKNQIEEYQKLYQRVAYNLMASDLGSIDRLNSNLPEEPMQLDQETLEKIIKIIFKPLPPRQRR